MGFKIASKNLRFLHFIYTLVGHCFCRLCLCYWSTRDVIFPPKENAILFVAHPDDDTLFFHTFIKEHKPYVVLCTTGWSLRRLPCFFRAMRYYGVRYRAYDMGTRDTRTYLLERHVKKVLSLGHFCLCATHNEQGEYGHEMHKCVHRAVIKSAKTPVLVPVAKEQIASYPLHAKTIEEKRHIFNHIYTTERWAIDQYTDWVENEQLTPVGR